MSERNFEVRARDPRTGEVIKVNLKETELRTMVRDSIWGSVKASMAIEGEEVPSSVKPPPIELVPERLLTTR